MTFCGGDPAGELEWLSKRCPQLQPLGSNVVSDGGVVSFRATLLVLSHETT